MIIGRDHAGVGDFYGMFEAQDHLQHQGIPASPSPARPCCASRMNIDWTFYCFKCDGMVSLRTCPHTKEDRVILSGTKLRKMLSEDEAVPDHFGREECLVILRKYYASLTTKVEVKMQRAASGDQEIIKKGPPQPRMPLFYYYELRKNKYGGTLGDPIYFRPAYSE